MAKVMVKQVDRKDYFTEEEYLEAQHAQLEAALKKFKKEVVKEGILKECRDRMYYVSKSEKKKAKKKSGRRKQLKQLYKERRYYSD